MDVVNRHCEFGGCTKTPSYGYPGERAQYCSNHHLPDMEDVKNRRCEWHECRRYPIFGREGERARFCSAHKTEDMVNVRNRKCEQDNCSKVPTHGFPDGKAQCCEAHVQPGMVNLKGRRNLVNPIGPSKHESQFDPRMLEASARATASGRQPGPHLGGEAHGLLEGMDDGGINGQPSRLGGLGMGPRAGAGNGRNTGHEPPRELVYGRHGQERAEQGPSPVMGWGATTGMPHEGIGNAGSDSVSAEALAHQGQYGAALHQEEQARWRRTPIRDLVQEEQRQRQVRVLGSGDLAQQYPRLRPFQHGYREQSQGHHEQEPSRSYGNASPSHELLPQIRAMHDLGTGDASGTGQVSSPAVSGVLGGRVTLPPPQRRLSVAQPRARRPLPPSPSRGNHAVYGGVDEAPLGNGRQGGTLSPFLCHQPSAPLRLPLPPVPPATSGAFPSDLRPVEWYDSQGDSGNVGNAGDGAGSVAARGVGGIGGGEGGGGGGGGGNGGGGSGNGSAWNKVGVSMGNGEYPHQGGDAVLAGMGSGGIAEGGNRAATSTGPSSLMMDGRPSGHSTGHLGTRLSSVDLGQGLMPPLDNRMQNVGELKNSSSPGVFPNVGHEMGGTGVAGQRPSLSSPQRSINDIAVAAVSNRPLSPLMSSIGDPPDSPPGIPRLRTLNSRRVDSHGAVSSSPPYLGGSSSPGPASLEGLPQGMQPSAASVEPHQTSLQALPGHQGEGMIGGAEGGHMSRAPLAGSGAVQGHEGAGVVGQEGWVPPRVVGARGTLDANAVAASVGGGGHDGEDGDPRKNLRIEELLH